MCGETSRQMCGETSRQMVVATRSPLAWSSASVSDLGERCDPGVRNVKRGLLSWAVRLPASAEYSSTGFNRFEGSLVTNLQMITGQYDYQGTGYRVY